MYYDVGMYSGIWTRNFVYLVRWHGQLMSALAGHCSPYKKRRANKDKLGRHQLTTPSSKVKKNPCSYSAIEIYSKLSGWHGRYVYCIFIDITINLIKHTKYIPRYLLTTISSFPIQGYVWFIMKNMTFYLIKCLVNLEFT